MSSPSTPTNSARHCSLSERPARYVYLMPSLTITVNPLGAGYVVQLRNAAGQRVRILALFPSTDIHSLEGPGISSLSALPAWLEDGESLEAEIRPTVGSRYDVVGRREDHLMVRYHWEGGRIQEKDLEVG